MLLSLAIICCRKKVKDFQLRVSNADAVSRLKLRLSLTDAKEKHFCKLIKIDVIFDFCVRYLRFLLFAICNFVGNQAQVFELLVAHKFFTSQSSRFSSTKCWKWVRLKIFILSCGKQNVQFNSYFHIQFNQEIYQTTFLAITERSFYDRIHKTILFTVFAPVLNYQAIQSSFNRPSRSFLITLRHYLGEK